MFGFLKEKVLANQKIKKVVGIFLIFVGFIALVTPFTPGSWLMFIGFELLGISILKRFWSRKNDSRSTNIRSSQDLN